MKIAIIGGGVAGLCAALRLQEANVQDIEEIVIFEREPQTGGLLQSTLKDEHWWDNGAFKFKKTNFLVERLPDIFEPFEGYQRKVWINNSLHEFPFKLKELISSSSPFGIIGAAMDYSISNLKQKIGLSSDNLHSWLKNRMTKEFLTKSGINDYIEKLQGLPTNQLSPVMGEKRLKYIHNMTRPGKILKNLFFPPKKKGKRAESQLVYPKENGVGSISSALTSLCRKRGISILCESDVQSIRKRTPEGFDIHLKESIYSASHVISTIPIDQLVHKLKPELPEITLEESKKIKFMNMQIAFFTVNRPSIIFPYLTLYSFSKKHLWKRLVARSVKNGMTSILAEATYNPETSSPEKNIIDIIEQNLTEELNLFKREEIVCRHSTTIEKAYPIYNIGFEKRVRKLLSEIETDRFQTAGRQGRFIYSSTPQVIESAFNAADNILENIRNTV